MVNQALITELALRADLLESELESGAKVADFDAKSEELKLSLSVIEKLEKADIQKDDTAANFGPYLIAIPSLMGMYLSMF